MKVPTNPSGFNSFGYSDKCRQILLEHKSATIEMDDGLLTLVEKVRIAAMGMDATAWQSWPSFRAGKVNDV